MDEMRKPIIFDFDDDLPEDVRVEIRQTDICKTYLAMREKVTVYAKDCINNGRSFTDEKLVRMTDELEEVGEELGKLLEKYREGEN